MRPDGTQAGARKRRRLTPREAATYKREDEMAEAATAERTLTNLQRRYVERTPKGAEVQARAEKVMPGVRDLFSDWEDKWWPKPLAKGQRASVPAFGPHAVAAE